MFDESGAGGSLGLRLLVDCTTGSACYITSSPMYQTRALRCHVIFQKMFRQLMEKYFSRDYSGGDFVLFGTAHLIGLGLVALVCLLVILFRRRFTPRAQVVTRWGLFLLIYLCEGSWQVWMLLTGQWTVQGMLPLWLCSVTAWTMPLLLVWRSRRYYEWAYFMGILGAAMALSTPDLTIYGFPHFR